MKQYKMKERLVRTLEDVNTELDCVFCGEKTIEKTLGKVNKSNVYYCVVCKKYIGCEIYDEPYVRKKR